MKYSRTRIEIVYDILLFIKNEKDGAKPTHILYKANLSPKLLNGFLKILTSDSLIRKIKVENKSLYRITNKGINFIDILKKLDKKTKIINLSHYQRTKHFS